MEEINGFFKENVTILCNMYAMKDQWNRFLQLKHNLSKTQQYIIRNSQVRQESCLSAKVKGNSAVIYLVQGLNNYFKRTFKEDGLKLLSAYIFHKLYNYSIISR